MASSCSMISQAHVEQDMEWQKINMANNVYIIRGQVIGSGQFLKSLSGKFSNCIHVGSCN